MKRNLLIAILFFSISIITYSQTAGDYRSIGSSTWSTIASWERYNGTTWVAAVEYPGQNSGTGNVTISNNNIIDVDVSPSYAIGSLTIASGNNNSVLQFNGPYALNVIGNIFLDAPNAGSNVAKSILMGNALSHLNCGSITMALSNNDTRKTFLTLVSGTVTVSGDITMGNNPTRCYIGFFGGSLNIGGNISGGRIDALTGGIVQFNGTGAQTVSTAYTFYNVVINKSSGVVAFGANTTISNTLTLTNGKINTGIFTLTLSNVDETQQITGGSPSSYVYSTGAGRLRRNGLQPADLNSHTFPVGSPSHYLPVRLVHSTEGGGGTTADYAVNVYQGVTYEGTEGGTPVFDKSNIVDACWNVDRPVGTGVAVLNLNWINALEGTAFSGFTDTQIKIAKHTAGNWTEFGAAYWVSGGGLDTASQSSNFAAAFFDSFSPFIVGGGSISAALPVKFGPFKAYEKQNGIQLDWKVYAEEKVFEYAIERSPDARSFSKIGSQPAIYNRSTGGDYGFFDANPLPGTSFYRIKNIDLDGKSAYSTILRVNRDRTIKGLKLYPNPVSSGIVSLQGSSLEKGTYRLNIISTTGQEVFNQVIIHNGGVLSQTIEIPSKIQHGSYLFYMRDASGNILLTEKILVN